jgi:probable HAF family extracellular repeat protein
MNLPSPGTPMEAFLWEPTVPNGTTGSFTALGTLDGPNSMGTDVNDADVVVGGAEIPRGWYEPFRWTSGGGMESLGTLGTDGDYPSNRRYHRAEAINAAGLIVGTSFTADGDAHGFIWEDGATDGVASNPEMKDLGTLGGDFSQAFAINDSDWVVGWSETASSDYHAFIWLRDVMVDLNDEIDINSTWELSQATDINNDGYITGWGTNESAETRAFQLEPARTCQCNGGGIALNALLSNDAGEPETGPFQPNELPPMCGAGAAPALALSLLGMFLMSGTIRRRHSGQLVGQVVPPQAGSPADYPAWQHTRRGRATPLNQRPALTLSEVEDGTTDGKGRSLTCPTLL